MQPQIRPWMLTYTIIFTLLSVAFVWTDFTERYSIVFTAWDILCYVLFFVGNLFYSLNRVPSSVRTVWKIIFPMLVLQFIAGGFGKESHDASVSLVVVAWIIGFSLFFPALRANLIIGYGRHVSNS
jgi:hypothetical protein